MSLSQQPTTGEWQGFICGACGTEPVGIENGLCDKCAAYYEVTDPRAAMQGEGGDEEGEAEM